MYKTAYRQQTKLLIDHRQNQAAARWSSVLSIVAHTHWVYNVHRCVRTHQHLSALEIFLLTYLLVNGRFRIYIYYISDDDVT